MTKAKVRHLRKGWRSNKTFQNCSSSLVTEWDPHRPIQTLQVCCPILVWRPSRESHARHRSSIFDQKLGTAHASHIVLGSDEGLWLPCDMVGAALGSVGRYGHVDRDHCSRSNGSHRANCTASTSAAARLDITLHSPRPTKSLRKYWARVIDRKLKTKGAETFGVLLFLPEDLGSDVKRMKIGPASDALRVAAEKLAFIVALLDERGLRIEIMNMSFSFCLEVRVLRAQCSQWIAVSRMFRALGLVFAESGEISHAVFLCTGERRNVHPSNGGNSSQTYQNLLQIQI